VARAESDSKAKLAQAIAEAKGVTDPNSYPDKPAAHQSTVPSQIEFTSERKTRTVAETTRS
jgi:hypothetical protein